MQYDIHHRGEPLRARALDNAPREPPTVVTRQEATRPTDKGLAKAGRPRHGVAMSKLFVVIGAVTGFLAVAAGAFGAHALKQHLSPDKLAVFETAVRYQMYHALGLILVGMLSADRPHSAFTSAGWAWVIGIALFSGSLYGLTLTGLKVFGPITPIGGVAFLVGWGLLAWGATARF